MKPPFSAHLDGGSACKTSPRYASRWPRYASLRLKKRVAYEGINRQSDRIRIVAILLFQIRLANETIDFRGTHLNADVAQALGGAPSRGSRRR
jgi:hypothetical protein